VLDAFDFLQRQLQVVPAEQREVAVRAGTRLLGGSRRAAKDERDEALRQRREAFAQHRMERGVGRHLLVVVEYERERRLETSAERFKIAPRENGQAGEVFGGQVRQRLAQPWCSIGDGHAQIMEERTEVTVPRVQLIPKVAQIAFGDIAAHERGLARARRSIDPDDRTTFTVKPPEQAFAQEYVGRARARDFCEAGEGRLYLSLHRCILPTSFSGSLLPRKKIGKSIRRRSLKDGPARRNPVLEPAPNRAHAHYVDFAPLRTPEGGDRSGV